MSTKAQASPLTRRPNDMLSVLWKEAAVGTEVYIFESKERQIADSKGLNDLDLTEMK